MAATSDGHLAGLERARQWPERVWAIEDCRHLTRRLEADLLRAGETVVRVPTRLMADARRNGRERGKSDPIDALAVARAAWREPDLPVARLDEPTRRLRLLVDQRDDLVAERTRVRCRLRWHLHEIDPQLEARPRGCATGGPSTRLPAASPMLMVLSSRSHVSCYARELLARCAELNRRIDELARQIRFLVEAEAPSLLTIPGCGALTAAKILGETAGIGRFRSERPLPAGTALRPSLCGQRTRTAYA